jgi:GABA(A) receptor-associated protein
MFDTDSSPQTRSAEIKRLLTKYPHKIPIIIEKDKSCTLTSELHANKFLVPEDLSVAQLLYTLRKRIMLPPEQAIFVFFNQQMVNSTTPLKTIYDQYKKDDHILYAVYSNESTFG